MTNISFQTILVPRGAEYRAVQRGLGQAKPPLTILPTTTAIPIGTATQQFLVNQSDKIRPPVLVMGLCGSLRPEYQVGDIVIYQSVLTVTSNSLKRWDFDQELVEILVKQLQNLPTPASLVTAWSSDRFIELAQTKQQIGQTYGAAAVDMEASAILKHIPAGMATLRVVSDDCLHDLPNLSAAISPSGRILPWPLLTTALCHPIGMTRLIRGATTGLKVLQQVTAALFAEK